MKKSLLALVSLVLVSAMFIGCAAQTTTTTTASTKRRAVTTGSNIH